MRKAILAVCFLALACGKQETARTESTDTSASQVPVAAEKAPPPTLTVQNKAPYGDYLVDGDGKTLYMFSGDTNGSDASKCNDACAKEWPPLTSTAPQPGGTAQVTLVDSFQRPDGSSQVTYNGWPLYTYSKDAAPGDTNGQGVKADGGEWYMVTPDGEKIEAVEKGAAAKSGAAKTGEKKGY